MFKLFTHTDLDGIGCAVLAKLAFGDAVDITYCNYDDINQKVRLYLNNITADECHITDISINEELAEEIDKTDEMLIKLLDHHPTALNLNKFDWCEVKIENEEGIKTSGTELYYKWLVKTGYLEDKLSYRIIVETIRDYDTWRWASKGELGLVSKQFNDLFHIYGTDKFIEWCLDKIETNETNLNVLFSEQDKLILLMKEKEIHDYIMTKNKELIIHDLCGYTCGFVFADRFVSELGNTLCKMNPEIDMVAMIDIVHNVISYRTIRGDIDLGKDIAKCFGGGGHPKAAGSQFDNSLKIKLIKDIFNMN